MNFLGIIIWLALVFVVYVQLTYILFKGKQYNRFFATFINVIVPFVGSVPTFIIACNYEKKIGGLADKLNQKIFRYVQIGLQLASVLILFLPFFSNEQASSSGINMIFGKASDDSVVRPTIILIYLIALPVVSALINFFYNKNNINNFISYSVALLNVLSAILMNFVVTSGSASSKLWLWIYCLINIAVMFVSTVLLVVHRDKSLCLIGNLDNKDSEAQTHSSNDLPPKNNTYICSKCGKSVVKGTICSCIEKRLSLSRENADNTSATERPDGFCIYCKRPLSKDENCNCLGDGFGITIKNEQPKSRKCMYCGQELVGESTCVCEKIMKNSSPAHNSDGETKEPKRFFEDDVEKSSSMVADEISELEKMINSRFEKVKESMNLDKDLIEK